MGNNVSIEINTNEDGDEHMLIYDDYGTYVDTCGGLSPDEVVDLLERVWKSGAVGRILSVSRFRDATYLPERTYEEGRHPPDRAFFFDKQDIQRSVV